MKKLLFAVFGLLAIVPPASAAFPIFGTVQISTDTTYAPALQTGAFNVSSGTVSGQLSVGTLLASSGTVTLTSATVSTATAAFLSVTSSMTSKGNVAIYGVLSATSSVNLGSAGNSVTISSNVIMPGTTIYSNGGYTLVTDSASIIQLNNAVMHYRKPRLINDGSLQVDVETGTVGTAGQTPIIFPDGSVYTEATAALLNAPITSTASWGNTSMNGGIRPSERQTANSFEFFYAVKSTATGNTTDWVLVMSTWSPVQSNFSTLNGAGTGTTPFFGTNGWVYLGAKRYGDQRNFQGIFLEDAQAGNTTWMRHAETGGGVFNGAGIEMATTGSAASLTYTYSSGVTGQTIPPNFVTVCYQAGAAGGTLKTEVSDSAGTVGHVAGDGTHEFMQEYWTPSVEGVKIANGSAVAMDVRLCGWVDGALGNNSQL